jgi:hypothetical protein
MGDHARQYRRQFFCQNKEVEYTYISSRYEKDFNIKDLLIIFMKRRQKTTNIPCYCLEQDFDLNDPATMAKVTVISA